MTFNDLQFNFMTFQAQRMKINIKFHDFPSFPSPVWALCVTTDIKMALDKATSQLSNQYKQGWLLNKWYLDKHLPAWENFKFIIWAKGSFSIVMPDSY